MGYCPGAICVRITSPPCFPIVGGPPGGRLITHRMLSDIIPTFGSLNMIGGECDH